MLFKALTNAMLALLVFSSAASADERMDSELRPLLPWRRTPNSFSGMRNNAGKFRR